MGAWLTNGSGGAPGGAAGGDLSGTYPAPTVAKLQGFAWHNGTPTGNQIPVWNSSTNRWEPASRAFLPLVANQGELVYWNGSAWVALGVGAAGQLLQSTGVGAAPSWATPAQADYRHMYASSATVNHYWGQQTTGSATARDVRAVRVIGSGTINFLALTALNCTVAGSISAQLYKGDGNTYSAIAGASRTLTTSVLGSQTDAGAQADVAVADGDYILVRTTGYSGTIASLSAPLRSGGGARLV